MRILRSHVGTVYHLTNRLLTLLRFLWLLCFSLIIERLVGATHSWACSRFCAVLICLFNTRACSRFFTLLIYPIDARSSRTLSNRFLLLVILNCFIFVFFCLFLGGASRSSLTLWSNFLVLNLGDNRHVTISIGFTFGSVDHLSVTSVSYRLRSSGSWLSLGFFGLGRGNILLIRISNLDLLLCFAHVLINVQEKALLIIYFHWI